MEKLIPRLASYLQKSSFTDLVSVGCDRCSMNYKRNLALIRQWKMDHEKEYAHFKAEVMRVSYGDFSAYVKIFRLAVSCIPQTVMLEIQRIMTGRKTESADAELDEFAAELANFKGYIEFAKVEDGEEFHYDIVSEKRDESKYLYERIPSALEFFYHLPWNCQCVMRTLAPDATDMELATMARCLYIKVCVTQDELRLNIENIGKRRDAFAMCVMYFVVFDHGLKTAYNALVRSLALEHNLGIFHRSVLPTMKRLIATSIEKGHDSKAAWKKEIQTSLNEGRLRDDMLLTVSRTKGISGRPRTATNIRNIDTLLNGDVASILSMINEYRKERTRPVDIAYLFIILRGAGLTSEHFYSTFHHAIEEYEGKKYSLRNPQEVFNNFPLDKEILAKKGTTHQKNIAREIDIWIARFNLCKKTA